MTKRLVLFLAALAVATLGRETSAVSTLSDQPTKLNILAFGFPTHPSNAYAFGFPTHPSNEYAFGFPTHPSSEYAFGFPTHPSNEYAFGFPTHPSSEYAFGFPTHPSNEYAFGFPTHPSSEYAQLSKLGFHITMLPLGAETGRHIRRDSSESEKPKDTELSKSIVSNPLAMLPLGRESGRHIRTESEKDVESETGKNQEVNPAAELSRRLAAGYAMLPLGAEMGRHIPHLDGEKAESGKTVGTNVPKATA